MTPVSRRFQLTANRVTLLRIALLPIPSAVFLYGPETWVPFAALGYVLLGLTDWLDGYLARRDGPTILGGLLDPAADKIFMAAVLVPLVVRGLCPAGVVIAIVLRELIVTSLRSAMSARGEVVETSTLAKLKTSVQMGGAGLVLLVDRVAGRREVLWLLGFCLLATAAITLAFVVRTGRVHRVFLGSTGLILFALAVRAATSPTLAIQVYWGVIVFLTWLSALDYLKGAWSLLARAAPIGATEFERLGWSLVVGVGVPAGLLELENAAPLLILILGTELSAGAMDNLRCHLGAPCPRHLFLWRGAIGLGVCLVALSAAHLGIHVSGALFGCGLGAVVAIGLLAFDAQEVVVALRRGRPVAPRV